MGYKNLLLILLVFTVSTFSESTSVYDTAMQLLITQNYTASQTVLKKRLKKYPNDIQARYLSFAVEQTRILDYESYIVEQKNFQTMADSTRVIFEKQIVTLSGLDSTICLFYLANVFGGIGVMQAKTGNWFEGVRNAVTSVSMLKQVKERQSDFYAADLGLGIFNYYLSTSLKWLPFVGNKEQEGLDAIELALQADFPYNYAAKNSLCWILIERENFRRADSIAQSVLKDYPDNTIFLRIKALIALWSGKYITALHYGKHLVDLTEKRQPLNWSDLAAGYTILVKGAYELGRVSEACQAANIFLNKKYPSQFLKIPHIKKNIKYIKNIRQDCHRKRK